MPDEDNNFWILENDDVTCNTQLAIIESHIFMDLQQIPRKLRIFFKFGMISPVMRLEFCFNVMLRKA